MTSDSTNPNNRILTGERNVYIQKCVRKIKTNKYQQYSMYINGACIITCDVIVGFFGLVLANDAAAFIIIVVVIITFCFIIA